MTDRVEELVEELNDEVQKPIEDSKDIPEKETKIIDVKKSIDKKELIEFTEEDIDITAERQEEDIPEEFR